MRKIVNLDTGELGEYCGQPAVFDATWTDEMVDAAYREIAGSPSMGNPWVIVLPNGMGTKPSGYSF